MNTNAATTNKKDSTYLAQIIREQPELISFLKEGDLFEATLLEKGSRSAYFDLGRFGTGIVYGVEFLNAKNIIKKLEIKETVNAKVVELDNDEGYVELSLAGAQKQQNWHEIKELEEKGESFTVKIVSANSGGLIAEVYETKAFLPVSQLSSEHYPRVEDGDKNKILEELKKLVDQELEVRILDFNPRTNKLIISEKEAVQQNTKEIISQYKTGDIVDCIVSGIADFGVFVRFIDNPVIEGLIHISELDHHLIDNPKEVVKIDDAVKAKITEIKGGQVSLSLKALKENPWDAAKEKFLEGQEITGSVYKFNPFGAYINLKDNFRGLIHISEFGGQEEMRKRLETEKEYSFIIDSVNPSDKRITLKLNKS